MITTSSRLLDGVIAALVFAKGCGAAVIRSSSHDGLQITYQENTICETTPGVKSYSGYVKLPATLNPALQPYDANMFFWFFEAKEDPSNAPLSIWLAGGPGSASMDSAVSGHSGPCIVQSDSNSTVPNPWSWNSRVNMLYIDQPVQTGFSYDVVTEGVLNTLTGDIDVSGEEDPLNFTAVKGKFPSQNPATTANTTGIAAMAISNFLQLWFQEFDTYKRDNISIWSESYGGHYAPAIAALLMKEKAAASGADRRRKCGSASPFHVGVDSVGIINGLIDIAVQAPFYPSFAVNNTYDIVAYNESVAELAVDNLYKEGGCMEQALACRALAEESDPDDYANNETVVQACGIALQYCWENVYGFYDVLSGRNWFDIAALMPDSFPEPYAYGFLNNEWVLEALGAKVNYSINSNVVGMDFAMNGDLVRGGFIEDLASLLDQGVKVALINGDRDFRCNWLGGEAVSLATNYSQRDAFAAAGYADISTNDSYVGGKVRQHGLFSFSRVYEAGHSVPHYQPETAYRIFIRSIFGRDVAIGGVSVADDLTYSTTGPSSVFDVKNAVPQQGPLECYVEAPPLPLSCTENQIEALLAGTAVVENRVVIDPAE